MKKIIILLLLLSQWVFAQAQIEVSNKLRGNWEGAFIKGNSYQKIEIQFSERDGNIFGLQIMDEWHPTYGEFEVPVEIDSIGKIKLATGYGKAEMVLDKNNLELVGQLIDHNPSIYLHLKKIARKPINDYTIEEISIPVEKIKLFGHLHIPKRYTKTAIIIVGGRSCYPDETKYNLYAKFLRTYGVTVLAYQKRGTGKSSGDCTKATITDLAEDLSEVRKFLESHSNKYEKIGVLGISAGGWTMTKAQERSDFDFMISVVGPSTSVKEQQLQSMQYGAEFYKLSNSARSNLKKYTELMFSAKPTAKDFQRMLDLLQLSANENWSQLLDDTDIPKNDSDIEQLWVRRHNFDPKNVLLGFKKPFLAIYGERDWIVPHKENSTQLKNYFSNKLDLLNTVVAHNAEHGMEMESKLIDLGNNKSYWHFYRISPEVRIEIVNFLNKYELIE